MASLQNNPAVTSRLAWSVETRSGGQHTVPSTIGEEKKSNPFMRVGEAAVLDHCKTQDPVRAMEVLRNEKNGFKG
jgi:hydroxyacylglutathione hydrolase